MVFDDLFVKSCEILARSLKLVIAICVDDQLADFQD